MYITITAQKLEGNYAQSASDFVDYLEKENEGKTVEKQEHFFNQYGEEISAEEVIREIDGNTAKLKKSEPKLKLNSMVECNEVYGFPNHQIKFL